MSVYDLTDCAYEEDGRNRKRQVTGILLESVFDYDISKVDDYTIQICNFKYWRRYNIDKEGVLIPIEVEPLLQHKTRAYEMYELGSHMKSKLLDLAKQNIIPKANE